MAVTRRRPRLAHGLALATILIGYVSLLGYVYGVDDLHRVGGFSSVAVHTAAAMIVAGAGLLWIKPELELVGLARESGVIGSLVRRLTLFAVVVPPVVSSIRRAGELNGLYDDSFGLAITTLAWTVGVLIATWLSARAALPIERKRANALADLSRRVGEQQALGELGELGLVAGDLDHLAQEAVGLLVRTLSAGSALFMVPGPDQVLTVSAVASPDGEATAPVRGTSVAGGVPVKVFTSGDPVVCDDMRQHPVKGMVEMGHLLGTDSAMAVAVPGRQARRGVLAVAGLSSYTSQDVQFLKAFAGLLGTALDRVESDAALRLVAEQRQALLGRLVTAQEEERARIADGVHDDQVQTMAALDLRLGLLSRRLADANPDLLPDLDRTRATVAGATERLRDLLFDLQPPTQNVALEVALRDAAAHIFEGCDTAWRVDSDGVFALADGPRVIAYRIAKEAMVNVRKHAQASAVTVQLRASRGGVEVNVEDDGMGMGPASTRSPSGHLGLSSMHDRALVAGGWVRIDSRPGEGTAVQLWLPGASPGVGIDAL